MLPHITLPEQQTSGRSGRGHWHATSDNPDRSMTQPIPPPQHLWARPMQLLEHLIGRRELQAEVAHEKITLPCEAGAFEK